MGLSSLWSQYLATLVDLTPNLQTCYHPKAAGHNAVLHNYWLELASHYAVLFLWRGVPL